MKHIDLISFTIGVTVFSCIMILQGVWNEHLFTDKATLNGAYLFGLFLGLVIGCFWVCLIYLWEKEA
jgi:hypothetical protein